MSNYLKLVENYVEQQIEERVGEALFNEAPILVHQGLCVHMMNIAREGGVNGGGENQEKFLKIMGAIEVLEEFYPQTKNRK